MFNGFDLSTIQDAKFGNSQISSIYYGANLIWPTAPHDYSQDYMTIVSLADNNVITWQLYNDPQVTPISAKTISVSTDGGSTWTNYTSSTAGTTLATLNNGDELLIKGQETTYGFSSLNYNHFMSTRSIGVQGNIMSMLYGDNFIGQTSLTTFWCLGSLFKHNIYCVTIKNLVLPATTLANYCYAEMFDGCTSLTTATELPATTLAEGCYSSMFSDCTSLTTAPVLPATTLANGCYVNMFRGCTSLLTVTELPATTLATYCYQNMFYDCTSLNYIKCLATDISATGCTLDWVNGVSASGTFVKDANTTWPSGTSGIPSGWTVQNA